MKTESTILTGIVLANFAGAHYMMSALIVNDTVTQEWKYVRDVAGLFPPNYDGDQFVKVIPQEDLHSSNITCGRNAFSSAAKTEIADVLAGSTVGFRVSDNKTSSLGTFWHPGPGMIYLSRALKDNVKSYRGDDDWFKIAYAGPENNHMWSLYNKTEWNFTIPFTTPPGQYLMRIEQFMPTTQFNYSQWYVNCAHINIFGPGGGKPKDFARFPGTYEVSDPGIWVPINQLQNSGSVPDNQMRLQDYIPPGPAVWTG